MKPSLYSRKSSRSHLWGLFLISLGLHGALLWLLIPNTFHTRSQPERLETIELMDLVAPQQKSNPNPSQPQPTAKPPSMPDSSDPRSSLSPPRNVVIPDSTRNRETRLTPLTTPQPIARPKSTIPPTSQPVTSPKQTISPTPQPTPTIEPSTIDIPEVLSQLTAAQGIDSTNLSPDPTLFAEPTLFFDSLNSRPQLKPDILRTVWIPQKTPAQVYVEVLILQGQRSNFQSSERGNFGGGAVYEVKQGGAVWYFNLVPTKDGNGTAIVVWKHDPSIHVQ